MKKKNEGREKKGLQILKTAACFPKGNSDCTWWVDGQAASFL